MKKLLLTVAVISAFSFASCKKDSTCTCTAVYADGSPSQTSVITIIDARKMDAKKMCINTTSGTGNDLETKTCTLK